MYRRQRHTWRAIYSIHVQLTHLPSLSLPDLLPLYLLKRMFQGDNGMAIIWSSFGLAMLTLFLLASPLRHNKPHNFIALGVFTVCGKKLLLGLVATLLSKQRPWYFYFKLGLLSLMRSYIITAALRFSF